MKRVTINRLLVAAGMTVCAAGQIYALPLIPGGTVTVSNTTAPAGSPVAVDLITGTDGTLKDGYNWKKGTGALNQAEGSYVNAVYASNTGQLNFYYQIQNTFKGSANGANTVFAQFDITDYTGFAITNVQQVTGTAFSQFKASSSGQTITSVSRSLSGSTLTVQLSGTLKPGQNSAVLMLSTNARNFQQGTSTFKFVTPPSGCAANTVAACGNAYFQPFSLNNLDPIQAPEPGFYGMLSMGIGGLLFAVRRRRSIKA